ncbi:AAA family ATPase [Thermopolyspora sp. NPDC052614]|uniref:ATP-binding protein n=1 Tax=Thermopolyspora sp. NPDC052614 TaxID=3155682 RepID=UPI00341A246D
MDTTFVGRRPELAEVGLLLKRSRLVTLTGAGGVGKTRLARRVLGDAGGIPVDLTVLVDLEPLDDPEALPYAVARSLGLEEDPARSAVEAMATWFRRRDVLLVLDTCDQLVDAVAELATALLRAVPNLRILTTGRQALGVPGEHVYLVRPMRLDDAVTLLRERLDARTPAVTDAEAAEACDLLDRLPLAIELAARWLPGGSVRELIGGLREGGEVPAEAPEGGTAGPRRHHSMRAAIGWSHELCTPRERLLWARMSVFGADFDLEAAEFVCSGGPLPADAVLDTIGGLVEKSVVFTCDHPGGARYRTLRGIRRFGARWLDRLGEREDLRRRHDDYVTWLNERGPK